MARLRTITRKDKFLDQETLFRLLDDYISDGQIGKRTKKNGQRIRQGSLKTYIYLRRYLCDFSNEKSFSLKIYIDGNLTMNQKMVAKRYYTKFYWLFTEYLYHDLDCYDNYVGTVIRCLRSFFNYLNNERHINVGSYHRSFYVAREEIPIVALSPEQLNYVIYDNSFHQLVQSKGLEQIKDIFVFGCTVALRVSDLLDLTSMNLHKNRDGHYLRVKSKKTSTHTNIKLPSYATKIVQKYQQTGSKLLPDVSPGMFNHRIKELGKLLPEDFIMMKIREKRGEQVVIYKDPDTKTHYHLSDHLSSHTMRRTAITTMLNLGMPEHMVRKISGHAPNSREFFRYVQLSQDALDKETERIFESLKNYS